MADATVDPDVQDGKGLAWLSYLGILLLIPLLTKKENKFCKFHVKQGLVLLITGVIYGVLSAIPFLGWFIIAPIGGILILILVIAGIIQSLKGNFWKMPVLGGFAEKFNF